VRCLKCDSETSVVDSRDIVGGRRRRRECKLCGYRFTTVEVASASLETSAVSRIKRWRENANATLEELDAILEEESGFRWGVGDG
jgi:transcriptional regulator NrdR family protein